MFSNRSMMAALLTIAIASSLIAMSGFAGSAFAAKKGRGEGDSVTNTMSNFDGNKDNPSTTSSDSSLYTGDPSKTTDNITPSSSGTGGVSISDLKTSSKCVSGAALGDGRLTLADLIIMFHLLILGMVDLRG